MVEMYHYQSMWNNRQHPRLHEIFSAVHGTDRLAVSIDRVGLKPPDNPAHPEYDHKGMIHWDTDMTRYPDIPFHVQGVLALTDTEADMGGFQCIPETYQNLAEFLKTQTQEKIASRNPDYTGYSITRPRLAAGDLLIWTSLLLHGNGHNTSNKVRLCQYISMNPADRGNRGESSGAHPVLAGEHPSAGPLVPRRSAANRGAAVGTGGADGAGQKTARPGPMGLMVM